MPQPTAKTPWRQDLNHFRRRDPVLYEKIIRFLMLTLHKEGIMRMEQIELNVSRILGNPDFLHWTDPNRLEPALTMKELQALRELVIQYASHHWDDARMKQLIMLAITKDVALRLEEKADDPFSTWDGIRAEVLKFCDLAPGGPALPMSAVRGARVALIRRLLTDQLELLRVARDTLTVRDIADIITRVIGPARGLGKLGGKATGFILAHDVLNKARDEGRPVGDFTTPLTYYVRSDVMLEFVKMNGLEEVIDIKYGDVEELRSEYRLLKQFFRNGRFPRYVVSNLARMLRRLGEVPLVVRSSSLLEDRLGAAFSGKYQSVFVANQGPLRQRLSELLGAITQVYASIFTPDAIQYRDERGLLDFKEEMACIIQPVVGQRLGRYWLPAFAGVAFSLNEYRWSPRLERGNGMVRLVAGLGTRAVDRVGEDYPRLFSPGQPRLRTNVHPDEVLRYSQRLVDVIDLEENKFATIPLEALLRERGGRFPAGERIFSVFRDGDLLPQTGMLFNIDPRDLIVTFNGLIERTPFAAQMKAILDTLAESWRAPVDVEFAHDGRKLYILQCRPQSRGEKHEKVRIPGGVPSADRIFSANRFVQMAHVRDIDYVVYVPPEAYEQVEFYDDLVEIGRAVGELNRLLPHRRFILIGPGRWGSRGDIKLGVRVEYADINHSRMLVEVARRKGGYVPDVSFGTHFFQDLVEADIAYLPLYPDEPDVVFNDDFLARSPSVLAEVLPRRAELADVVRVIRVPDVTGGRRLHVAMDADRDRALAYIGEG